MGLRRAGGAVGDRRGGAELGGRVGARRAAERQLVDVDDLVDVLDPLDGVVGAGKGARLVQAAGQRLVERLDAERRLAAAGYARDAGEGAAWHRRTDHLLLVLGCAALEQLLLRVSLLASPRSPDQHKVRDVIPTTALR